MPAQHAPLHAAHANASTCPCAWCEHGSRPAWHDKRNRKQIGFYSRRPVDERSTMSQLEYA
eukprot:14518636-Alexandrium_andersonii.AAC.1